MKKWNYAHTLLLLTITMIVVLWFSTSPIQINTVGAAKSQENGSQMSGGNRFVLIYSDQISNSLLEEINALVAIDYGTYYWLEVTPDSRATLDQRGIHYIDFPSAGEIQVPNFRFDPIYDGEPPLPYNRLVGDDEQGFWLVKFNGPIRQQWLVGLQDTGMKVLQYYPHYSFLVWASADQINQSSRLDFIRWQGRFYPAYKINDDLDNKFGRIENVDVIFYNDGFVNESLQAIRSAGGSIMQYNPAQPDEQFMDAIIQIDSTALENLASINSVLWLGYASPEPQLEDEMSDQIEAGNYNGGVPFVGYQDWLANLGYDGAGVIWAPIDTGVDYDHPDIGPNIIGGYSFPGACDPVGQPGSDCSGGGHGTHVTGIIGGTGIGDAGGPYTDANGFLYGLGVAPGFSIYAMNSLSGSAWPPTGGWQEHSKRAILGSAIGGNNSWTTGEGTQHGYQASERTHDFMVLDGNFDTTNIAEPFIEIFSAGNSGTSGLTAPKEAKNLIVVASSRNYRAGSIDTISSFSSRGPAVDGRWVPTIAAPGEQIASTRNDLGGDCATAIPNTNSLYAFCSGTSMAAPHASGAVVLITEWWRAFNDNANPSPAMAKALLVNGAVDMGAANIPNIEEGWGRINLPNVMQNPVPVMYFDQEHIFDNSGESWNLRVNVQDPSKPLKITLAWSDAPGAIGANPALVNNLDLIVQNGSNNYFGNVFSSGWSITGGNQDILNNLENVYIQNPQSETIITIQATNIAGDAIPYSGDTTDQSFALVCQNCISQPDYTLEASPETQDICIPDPAVYDVSVSPTLGYTLPVTISVSNAPQGYAASFGANPVIPPAASVMTLTNTSQSFPGSYSFDVVGLSVTRTHTATLGIDLFNATPLAPTLLYPPYGERNINLTPTLSWTQQSLAQTFLLEISSIPGFDTLVYSATVTGNSHAIENSLEPGKTYFWRVRAANVCGSSAFSTQGYFTTEYRFCSVANVPIPDDNTIHLLDIIDLPEYGSINDLNVYVKANHTYVGDLSFTLQHAESGVSVTMIDRPGHPTTYFGCRGDNIDATLDDGASLAVETACASSIPAISGSFYPNNPLNSFDGNIFGGTWNMFVRDHVIGENGTLIEWCLLPDVDLPILVAEKSVDQFYPSPGKLVTYTIGITNFGTYTATNVVISDTLPDGLTFVGPVEVTPPQPSAQLAESEADLPVLASGLVLEPLASLNLTFPVMLSTEFTAGTIITNVASITSTEVSVPVTAEAFFAVNSPPTASPDTYQTQEDETLVVSSSLGVLVNDIDLEGTPLSTSIDVAPINGTLLLNQDGSFEYTPSTDFNGTDTFSYVIFDGGLTDTTSVTITVQAVNDPPNFISQPVLSATVGHLYSYPISVHDVDLGDVPMINTESLPGWLTLQADENTALLSGVPGEADTGEHRITLIARDLSGENSTQEFTIFVHEAERYLLFLPSMLQSSILNR